MTNKYLTKIAEEMWLEKEASFGTWTMGLLGKIHEVPSAIANSLGRTSAELSKAYQEGQLSVRGGNAARARKANYAARDTSTTASGSILNKFHDMLKPSLEQKTSFNAGKAGKPLGNFDPLHHAIGVGAAKVERNPKTTTGILTAGAALPFVPFVPKLLSKAKNLMNPSLTNQAINLATKHPIGAAAGIGGTGLLVGNMLSNNDNRNN